MSNFLFSTEARAEGNSFAVKMSAIRTADNLLDRAMWVMVGGHLITISKLLKSLERPSRTNGQHYVKYAIRKPQIYMRSPVAA